MNMDTHTHNSWTAKYTGIRTPVRSICSKHLFVCEIYLERSLNDTCRVTTTHVSERTKGDDGSRSRRIVGLFGSFCLP